MSCHITITDSAMRGGLVNMCTAFCQPGTENISQFPFGNPCTFATMNPSETMLL